MVRGRDVYGDKGKKMRTPTPKQQAANQQQIARRLRDQGKKGGSK